MPDPSFPSEHDDPRVRLAGERTLLAWLRTGLALMGFGFVVARFGLFLREVASVRDGRVHSSGWSLAIGTALVLLGVGVTAIAAWEHRRFNQRLDRQEPFTAPRRSLGLAVAVILVVIGLGMAAYLMLTAS